MKGITAVKHISANPNNCPFASYSPNGSFFLLGSDNEIVNLWSLNGLVRLNLKFINLHNILKLFYIV